MRAEEGGEASGEERTKVKFRPQSPFELYVHFSPFPRLLSTSLTLALPQVMMEADD